MKGIAVITGDIVSSREIQSKERQSLYEGIHSFLNSLKKEKWILNYEMFRGDSFQCVLNETVNALRVSLLIRAFVIAYVFPKDKKALKDPLPGRQDIRLSIGVGEVDFYNKKNVAQSDGEAFKLSGEELDNLKKAQHRMALKTSDTDFNDSIEPAVLLLDAVLQKWTANQAQSVLHKLKNFKEDEIATILKISQSAVNQRIRTSQWFAIEKLLSYFEAKIKDS